MNAILPFELKLQFCFRAKWDQTTFMKHTDSERNFPRLKQFNWKYIQKASERGCFFIVVYMLYILVRQLDLFLSN